MIQKKPIKYFFDDSNNLFEKRTGNRFDAKDIEISISRLFDIGFNKAIQSSKPLVKKSIRIYKVTDEYIVCNVVKYDYFCNTIRGHLKIYNGYDTTTYIKTNNMFYDTGYRSNKETESLRSYYEKKKGAPENNVTD